MPLDSDFGASAPGAGAGAGAGAVEDSGAGAGAAGAGAGAGAGVAAGAGAGAGFGSSLLQPATASARTAAARTVRFIYWVPLSRKVKHETTNRVPGTPQEPGIQ